jgi:hypothetical protein
MSKSIRRLHLASCFLHPASCLLHLASCLLLLSGCLPHTSTPPPTPTLLPTITPGPEPVEGTSPPPTLPSTPPPVYTPTSPDHAQSLRPEFAADLDQFPDATRYEIELTVDLDTATVTGREHIRYTNTEDVALDALYLRLFPNTPGYGGAMTRQMTTTAISLDGRPAEPTAELDGSALRLSLDPPLERGEVVELALDFTLAIPTDIDYGYGQLGYYDGVLALANAYPLVPVYDDEGWNVEVAPTYGDAVYSDTAFYVVRVTAPADVTLIASGTCTAPTPSPDGSTTWTCVTGPVRDFNAVLGADYQVESRVVEGITVNSVFYPRHQEGGERVLDTAAEAVRLFNARFGAYPFTELDVVETPTRAGGIEYPGLVVINSTYYETLSEEMEWVVVHEVGHQWWYSLVGNDQVDEPWLDEALVQYSTLLYYEERYGAELAAALVEQVFQRPYAELVESDRDAPAGLPVAAYSGEDYGPVVYRKGPLYFHALRQEVGEEDFWAILQAYFAHHRYGVATPEDWLATVEAVAGDAHRSLYERWITGTGEQ